LSAGGLKLTAKQERYTRFKKRKIKDPRAIGLQILSR
jgi:hypothetical protein